MKNDAQASSQRSAAGFTWNVLERFDINPETRKKLVESGVEAWCFVSWLLYAWKHSERIKDPLAFAVAQTLSTRKGAGGQFDR